MTDDEILHAHEHAPGDRCWADLMPDGRVIFYEGDDPDGFAIEIWQRFGFDVTKDSRWCVLRPPGVLPMKPIAADPDNPIAKQIAEIAGIGVDQIQSFEPVEYGGIEMGAYVSHAFHCPRRLLCSIYAGDYPMGS